MEISEHISVWEHLQKAEKPVVLYGMGNGADKILNVCTKNNITVAGVFASDGFVRGHQYRGFQVFTYERAKEKFGDMIVLVAFGTDRPEVIQNIVRITGEQELYAPEVPLMGEELFDLEYFYQKRDKLKKVFGFLEDGGSQHAFLGNINFKISGKINYLLECQSDPAAAFREIFAPSAYEVYLDGGAYTGDTVIGFAESVKGYKKIIAVEPDLKNFRKLSVSSAGMRRVRCLHLGLGNVRGRMAFAAQAGRNSAFDKEGAVAVPVDTIDHILNGHEVTLIKLDVEGQEAPALLGAQKTITKYKPKILVAAYHRSRDLFALPLLLREIRPDYKVYLRSSPGIPAWDTFYYFV